MEGDLEDGRDVRHPRTRIWRAERATRQREGVCHPDGCALERKGRPTGSANAWSTLNSVQRAGRPPSGRRVRGWPAALCDGAVPHAGRARLVSLAEPAPKALGKECGQLADVGSWTDALYHSFAYGYWKRHNLSCQFLCTSEDIPVKFEFIEHLNLQVANSKPSAEL